MLISQKVAHLLFWSTRAKTELKHFRSTKVLTGNIRAPFLSLCYELRGFECQRLSFDAIKLKFYRRRNEGMILWKGQCRPPVWLIPDVPLNVDVNAPDKRVSLVFELWASGVVLYMYAVRSPWSYVQNTTPLECNLLFLFGLMFIFVPVWGLPDVSLWEIFLFTMPSPCLVFNIAKRI